VFFALQWQCNEVEKFLPFASHPRSILIDIRYPMGRGNQWTKYRSECKQTVAGFPERGVLPVSGGLRSTSAHWQHQKPTYNTHTHTHIHQRASSAAGCGRCVRVLSKHIRFGFISAWATHKHTHTHTLAYIHAPAAVAYVCIQSNCNCNLMRKQKPKPNSTPGALLHCCVSWP